MPIIMNYPNRRKTTILTYHGFNDVKDDNEFKFNYLYINKDKFRLQMGYLRRRYNVISLNELIECQISGRDIPCNAAVVTIDDGYKSVYQYAYPVLKELGLPATVFLSVDFIDKKEPLYMDRVEYAITKTTLKDFQLELNGETLRCDLSNNHSRKKCYSDLYFKLISINQDRREMILENLERGLGEQLCLTDRVADKYQPLSWYEIKEMLKSKIISIGSHSRSHAILSRSGMEQINNELVYSRKIIEERAGVNCELFSYPNGALGDFNRITRDALKGAGYKCGLVAVAGFNDKHSDIFELRRFYVDTQKDIIFFIMTITGVINFFNHVKESIKAMLNRLRA